jgi:hypothetical protein
MATWSGGYQFDASGNLLIVFGSQAVAPTTIHNGIKFDANGYVVVAG